MLKFATNVSPFNKNRLYNYVRLFGTDVSIKGKMVKSEKIKYITFEEIRNKGILMLNRKEHMNAVTRPMLKEIYLMLLKWELRKDLVILRPMGDQNLSVGGDLKAYYNAMREYNQVYKRGFMCLLYITCYLLGTYKIKYLSIMNGPTMGAGLGMAVHAKYKIVTDKSVIAMPEPRVGMFTDASSTYFLPRLQGKLGFFLALTGYKLKGTDALHAGIATHYVPSNELESVYQKLLNLEVSEIGQFLNENYSNVNSDFSLAPYMSLINHCFSHDSITDIIKSLHEDGSTWAKNIIQQIYSASPTALKITHTALKKGSRLNLAECLTMEYRIAIHYTKEYCDFVEGIRAMLIDKDHTPRWNPSRIENVDDKYIESLFLPIPDEFELPVHDREMLFM